MAEIRIEENKSPSILPWIIGLLLLGLVIWGVAEAFDDDDDMDEVTTEEVIDEDDYVAPTTADVGNDIDYRGPITSFMDYTADMEGEMGLGHEFSHRAMTLLATATSALAEAKDVEDATDADSKSARVERMANEIMEDPMAGTHADKIRMSAMLITEVLEDVNARAYNSNASSQLSNLRQEAQAITAETLTLNQKEDVRSFFNQARQVLSRMSS